ncbi:MAG: desulfoferrodoxin [Clostridiales Family XIII bacterium]|jgi:superoxide reductase|nr:desulfoferrodoxin [Clostridiales Family XIII bacterium]
MIDKKFYKCNHCGNIFGVINDAKVVPMCCGEPMVTLVANTTDAAQEKHVPVIERDGAKVTVKVGSVPHPMTPEHYIQWIMVTQGDFTERAILSPDGVPEASFTLADADAPVKAYEYCNLHGLWSAEA